MKGTVNLLEKAIVSAFTAVIMGFGIITLLMGICGVKFGMVNCVTLMFGYVILCMAMWLVLMLPYIKKI